MHFIIASVVAFVGIASAAGGCAQAPVGDSPSGNPISAPLSQVVPAGTPFTITWSPTTAGSVSIVLLRGPSTNVLPIGCLAENLPNTGQFVWTPSTALEADPTHYGIQVIVTGTGQYQYSTQFGISNPVGAGTSKGATISQISDGQIQAPVSTSATGASSAVSTSASVSSSAVSTSASASASASSSAVITSAPISSSANATSVPTLAPLPTIIPSVFSTNSANATNSISIPAPTFTLQPQTLVPVSTGLFPNSSIIQPTSSMTVPATLQTSAGATTAGSSGAKTSAPIATGAAATTLVGRTLAGLGMVAAFML